MSEFAIRAVGLSKRYRIGAYNASPFWALKDVSFQVEHGERVGVIGRNGSGKSTLLKILSRITKPTEGYADVYGRVGSLLEVGTGFHPELSGRENIYLNATVLGLRKAEVDCRFDEIVAFAEIEKFLDTPVKHYSSGMYMRLAFSVSAHLDPDILVLDEVLAVGDAAFQRKCLAKMEGVAKEGRTVLLVSHSVPSIVSFCDRCILLDQGRIIRVGSAVEVTEYYQESLVAQSDKSAEIISAEKNKTGRARFTSIRVSALGNDGAPQQILRVGQDLEIEATIVAHEKITDSSVAMVVFALDGQRLIDADLALKNNYLTLEANGEATVRFTLRNVLLKPDTYRISLWLGRRAIEDIDIVSDAARFVVEVDPRRSTHFQSSPALYQCEYTQSVSLTSASTQTVNAR